MNVERIELENFGSWENASVHIEPSVTLISGPNGSGKSTLLSAIEFGLYGATSDPGRMIRRGTDEARVRIDVDLEDHTLVVERGIRRSGRATKVSLDLTAIYNDGESVDILTAATVTESQALLDQHLGVSREVLLASAFSTQHGGAAFTEAAPRDRKRVLGEVLSLGMWEQLAGRARGDLQDAKYQAQIAQAIVEQHDGAEGRLAGVAKVLGGARADLVLAEQAEAAAEGEAARLAAEAESAREARRQHAAAADNAARASRDHAHATGERRAADEALAEAKATPLISMSEADARAEDDTALAARQAEITRHKQAAETLARWRSEINDADQVLADLAAESATGNCARCGQPLHTDVSSRVSEAQAIVENLKRNQPEPPNDTALAVAEERHRDAAATLSEAQLANRMGTMIGILQQRSRDAMDREMETAEQLRLAIILSKPAPVIDESAEAKHMAALDAATHARLAHHQSAADLARAEAAAAQAEREANAEADARTRLATAQHDAAISEILAAGFGPNGVPALVIDNVLGQLADEANRVLAELGTPIRVDLRSQRVTQAGKLIDALDIIVLDGVDEAPYETLSGGERTRVALALRAALTRLLAAKSGARVRILVVDEPQGLDAAGAEAFADVLQAFITARIFDTALIVTHDERLADRIDRVISVTKTPGGSSRLAENSTGPASPSIPSAGPVELQEVTDA